VWTCILIMSTLNLPVSLNFIVIIKKKGKVLPCTGTEALYRPYDP